MGGEARRGRDYGFPDHSLLLRAFLNELPFILEVNSEKCVLVLLKARNIKTF